MMSARRSRDGKTAATCDSVRRLGITLAPTTSRRTVAAGRPTRSRTAGSPGRVRRTPRRSTDRRQRPAAPRVHERQTIAPPRQDGRMPAAASSACGDADRPKAAAISPPARKRTLRESAQPGRRRSAPTHPRRSDRLPSRAGSSIDVCGRPGEDFGPRRVAAVADRNTAARDGAGLPHRPSPRTARDRRRAFSRSCSMAASLRVDGAAQHRVRRIQ